MKIANLDDIRAIGKEYGWDDRTIEETLAHAIRMCYAERGMLAEVDVDMASGTIAARRRAGEADRGVWIDIDKPLMPTVKMFINVMEMRQWGDGAPGRILEGEVTGYRDGGVLYRVLSQFVVVPENLLSVTDYQKKPAIGQKQVIVLCASKDQYNMRMATRRGKEFVAAVMECYYPDCVSGIWMGASNSWAVIRMNPEVMTKWLENNGVNVKYLQNELGLRRITLVPEGEGATEQERADAELKHFVNNAWRKCKIAELYPTKIVLHTPLDEADPRKLRTFCSMLQKLAPEREQVIL
jgi:hypothetical protein